MILLSALTIVTAIGAYVVYKLIIAMFECDDP